MKILIIDDNPDLVRIFENILRIKGFSVDSESSLKSGLRTLQKKSYEVAFVDSPLDDYNEQEILNTLQEIQIFQKTSVILFSSADFNSNDLINWKNNGLYSFLKKPVKRDIIIKILDNIKTRTLSKNEPPTSQQSSRLEQLEKQISELQNTEQPTPDSTIDDFLLNNIISDLKSIESQFGNTSDNASELHVTNDFDQNQTIKNEMAKTISEISKFKNELQLLDKTKR